jgi:hypothetical protein
MRSSRLLNQWPAKTQWLSHVPNVTAKTSACRSGKTASNKRSTFLACHPCAASIVTIDGSTASGESARCSLPAALVATGWNSSNGKRLTTTSRVHGKFSRRLARKKCAARLAVTTSLASERLKESGSGKMRLLRNHLLLRLRSISIQSLQRAPDLTIQPKTLMASAD